MSSPKRRNGSRKQITVLENEMKCFLDSKSRTTAYRAATYKPALLKFQSTSFSNYVRRVLLGVPVTGVEEEEPYFSNDEEEDDIIEINGSEKFGSDWKGKRMSFMNEETKFKTNALHPKQNMKVDSPSMKEESVKCKAAIKCQNRLEKLNHDTLNIMTTRSQSDPRQSVQKVEEDNIYSRSYQYRYKIQSSPSSANLFVKKKNSGWKKPLDNALQTCGSSTLLKPDSLKLSDGMAKIIPPIGWWDKAAIRNDSTARGKFWEKGTKLGDLVIPQPIRQCVAGIGGVYDFTMMELSPTTVSEFRDQADTYRKRQTGKEFDEDETDDHMDMLARKFWKRLGPTMESSQYGADMEGSLFGGAEACGWNVDSLESCLALLQADSDASETEGLFKLPGVNSSYLYFGMWASVFCAHNEDMNLLSINYLHAGAPKYWYAIAQEDSYRFESLMASMFSHEAASCGQFLRHKRSLLSPSLLTKAGISYTTQVQRAGDIMITFPGSYHFGFNTGFNCAESTNFAVPEWVPFGENAKICLCHPHSVRIDMSRFKDLMKEYDDDASCTKEKLRSTLSYTQWTQEYVRRKKRRRDNVEHKMATLFPNKKKLLKASVSSSGYIVEVMKVSTHRTKLVNQNHLPNKLDRKKKSKEVQDLRIALPMEASRFILQTPVLCYLECENNIFCYFAGTIVDIVEDHAKIHFLGTSRNQDVWMAVDSEKIFLDGGSTKHA